MLEQENKEKRRTFSPAHAEPGDFSLDFILLPYGEFYKKTRGILEAKRGDTLRFFNGPQYEIDSVSLIPADKACDALCRMRYKIPLVAFFKRWEEYATLEGHGKDVISKSKCIFLVYEKKNKL